jgi:E3 ubiquitin-protein ligase MYLIP
MQARQMLIDDEVRPSDWKQAARFIALISQAEGVKFIPELLSPNGQKIMIECQRRKRVDASKSTTSSLTSKDKRQSFDENISSSGSLRFNDINNNENNDDNDNESGYDNNRQHLEKFVIENYLEHTIRHVIDTSSNCDDEPEDYIVCIAREHQKIHTMSQSSAKYWLLEEFSTLPHFGEEMFEGTLISESESKIAQTRNEKIQIAVNPHGLVVKKLESTHSFSIPFSAVESAKSLRRCFHLCYLNENYTDSSLVIKFTSHRIAGTLYRALTEKHSFYSCETVHKNVETQFIRDLKVREIN